MRHVGTERLKVCCGAAHRHVMSVCSGKEVCSSGLQEKGINFKFEEKFFLLVVTMWQVDGELAAIQC